MVLAKYEDKREKEREQNKDLYKRRFKKLNFLNRAKLKTLKEKDIK